MIDWGEVGSAMDAGAHPVPAAPEAAVVAMIGLGRGARKFAGGIVAFTDGGCEFLAQPIGRSLEIIAALGCRFGKCRIGEVPAIPDASSIFFQLNLAFEIGGHLVEFADDPFQVFDLSGFFVDLAAF
jgi:hypothetical protein